MSILTREEFAALIVHHTETLVAFGQAKTASGVHMLHDQAEASGRRVMAAYDAALARIAELDPLNKRIVLKLHEIVNRNPHPDGSLGQNLEDVIDRQITALMRENELLGQHNARLQQRIAELESPAHRASIAREFYDEAAESAAPHAVLARWEAAAKEGE